MTEEERQRTILELERATCKFPSTAEDLGIKTSIGHYGNDTEGGLQQHMNEPKCECCGEPLIEGRCPDHASYMRSHQVALNTLREQYKERSRSG